MPSTRRPKAEKDDSHLQRGIEADVTLVELMAGLGGPPSPGRPVRSGWEGFRGLGGLREDVRSWMKVGVAWCIAQIETHLVAGVL